MYTGEDVEPALSSTHLANRIKSNIFGVGFEDGYKVSVGCSYKGRVWTRKTGNIEEFVKWCNHIGSKLLDDNINSDDILSEALYPEVIDSRPNLMPISIEWNETLFNSNERNLFIECNGNDHPIYTVDLELYNASESGDICFKIYNDVFCSLYKMEITNKGFEIINIDNPIFIRVSANKRYRVEDYFYSKPPIIRFFNGAWLEGNQFINFEFKGSSYNRDKIAVWNWSDVNIREESQKEQKIPGTIQRKVIVSLLSQEYDIIFDDDGSGEAADIIAVKINDDLKEISVEFYHLKFSSADVAGARIGDLYEVCGQAQKSILWKGKGGFELFKHMIHREALRLGKSQNSRFEKGTLDELNLIKAEFNLQMQLN